MYSNDKLPKADKYLNKRKKLSLWHRLLLLAGSVVVFVTTYMLILPAITAEIGTLEIFNDSVTSGSAIEGTTQDDDTTESSSHGGGGSNSTATLPDGSSIDIKLEEIKTDDKKTEKEQDEFYDMLLPKLDPAIDKVVITIKGGGDNDGYLCIYDPETGKFKAKIAMDFVIPQDALTEDALGLGTGYSKSYVVDLPKELIVPDNIADGTWRTGFETGTEKEAFQFNYEAIKDAEGNITNYRLSMVFLDSFITGLNGDNIKGTVKLDGLIDESVYQEDGSIKIKDDGLFDIDIPSTDIKFTGNESINGDINVEKTGSYDAASNTITYTVTAITQKGMGDTLTIEDSFTDSDFLSSVDGELVGVEYKQGPIGYYKDQWGHTTIKDDQIADIATTPLGTDGAAYYTQNADGSLEIVLPGLGEAPDEPYNNNDWEKNVRKANAYVITYTYSINPKSGVTYTGNNRVVAKIKDRDVDLSSEANKNVTVTGKTLISKTGSLSDNKITWTITVGDGDNSLAGCILTDEMFGELTVEQLETAISGAVKDTDYEIVYAEDGTTISGIKFKEGATSQYTIVYQTDGTPQWDSQNITNKAQLTDTDNNTYDATHSIGISGVGSNSYGKWFGNAERVDDTNIYNLTWGAKFSVPESGIPADITFEDYVEGTGHYITYEQAQNIVAELTTALGAENIKDIQFFNGENTWSWGAEWVNADAMTEGTKYYRFRFTTANKIDYDTENMANNEKSYSYITTADTTGITNTAYYKNNLKSEKGNTVSPEWKYDRSVVKYALGSDGNLKNSGSTIETKDGVVSWVVRIALDKAKTTYKITDNLPVGVTLNKVYVAQYEKDNYQEVTDISSSLINGAVTAQYASEGDSTSGQTITVDTALDYTKFTQDYMYVKYECTIVEEEELTESKNYSFANNVTVTTEDETPYGGDTNDSTFTWVKETKPEEDLTKDAYFNKNDNIIEYSLGVNPEGKMYTVSGEEYSYLNLKDTLSYKTFPEQGFIRDASLMMNSVKLYYARVDSEGKAMLGEDGKYLKGAELDASKEEYSWSFDEESKNLGWGTDIFKYINLKIPNGVPLVFEYKYVVKIVTVEGGEYSSWDTNAAVTNGAQLTIGNKEVVNVDGGTENSKVEDSGTSGQAGGDAGYTLYKVDNDNFALTLNGAQFDLYVWDKNTSSFKKQGSVTTENGRASISGKENKENGAYDVKISGVDYSIPYDTMCYLKETVPPDGYKLDETPNYFFFGKTAGVVASACEGYDSGSAFMSTAYNVVIPHTEYIKNKHSVDYYAEKTSLTVFKKWINAAGEDITSMKADGSIKFKLMRVYTALDGSSGGGGSGSGGGTNCTLDVNVQSFEGSWNPVIMSNDSDNSDYDARIPKTCKKGTEVTWVVTNKNPQSWQLPPALTINGESLGYSDFSEETITGEWGATQTLYHYTYKFTVNGDTTISGWYNINASDFTLDKVLVDGMESTGSAEETTTEETTETTTTSSGDTKLYGHQFGNDDTRYGIAVDTDKEGGNNYTDGFFTFNGNLSRGHGSATWAIDDSGDPAVLNTCLKMQTATEIRFTAEKSGVLTLVFNENGNGEETTPIVNNCNIDGTTYTAYNNYIKRAVSAGEHVITKKDTCYLFYISFEEGATLIDSDDIYKHGFNGDKSNRFYTVSDNSSVATDKGTVTYDDTTYQACLKMNSKAEITFNAPFEGTIYLIMTNPNGDAKVGVNIDGVDHHAVETGMKDSNNNTVYLLPIRVKSGLHTIKRINGTENMLYYIEYLPDDDYNSADLVDTPPNNPDAVVVNQNGTPDSGAVHTITAANEWTKLFTNLPWQVIDEETGETLGYYSYYVEEIDNDGYITKYKNSVAEGISSGSMGIYNQDTSTTGTIKIIKKWLGLEGNDESALHNGDKVTINLFRKIKLNEGETLDTTKTESHSFVNYLSDFYTISSNNNPYDGIYGSAKYGDKTYTSCLKTEGKTSIKFTAPADGKLTLVFGSKPNYDPEKETNTFLNKIGFKLTHNGSSKEYTYDLDSSSFSDGCTGTYSGDGAVFALDLEAGDYEIVRANKIQCYLYYMDYTYKLSDAAAGVKVGSYILGASDVADDNWTKVIDGLPIDIKDENNRVIGHYSYYVEEADIPSGYRSDIEYAQTGVDDNLATRDITDGIATVTNQKTTETGIELPETGGVGTKPYTAAGVMLLAGSGIVMALKLKNYLLRV